MIVAETRWDSCVPLSAHALVVAGLVVLAIVLVLIAWFDGSRDGLHTAAQLESEALNRAWQAGWDARSAASRRFDDGLVPTDDATTPQPRPLPTRWSGRNG